MQRYRVDDHPDFLRSPDSVCQPDPRQEGFAVLSATGFRQKEIEDQYNDVADIMLHSGVPDGIRVQFETAKNLYLYSWFVYRFYPVSRTHAYGCLELALRRRLGAEIASEGNRGARVGLKRLLKYAIERGLLQNENFSIWRQRTMLNARMRILYERLAEEDDVEHLEHEVEIRDVDCEHDYLGELLQSAPYVRNKFAHGSESLDSHVLGALQQVAEIINQLFAEGEPNVSAT